MNSNIATWGVAGLLVLSGAANFLLWQRADTLEQRNKELSSLQGQVMELQERAAMVDKLAVDYQEMEKLKRDTVELARLRNETAKARAQGPEVAKLQAQLVQLTEQLKKAREALAAQQANMQEQLAASVESAVAADQAARAASIACVNNMKRVCLALRMWANDHNEALPPAIAELHVELDNNPAVLTCPSDPQRRPLEDWRQVGPNTISYQYLLPNSVNAQANPEQPMVTCPIHGHVGRADGSVVDGQAAAEAP